MRIRENCISVERTQMAQIQ